MPNPLYDIRDERVEKIVLDYARSVGYVIDYPAVVSDEDYYGDTRAMVFKIHPERWSEPVVLDKSIKQIVADAILDILVKE